VEGTLGTSTNLFAHHTHSLSRLFLLFIGKYCRSDHQLEGAPGPMIIHASGTRNKDEDCNAATSLDDEFQFNPKYLDGLADLDADPEKPHLHNPMNFDVRCTPNGSMDKQRFLDWCHHFVTNLPSTQGKGKEPVFLLLDGHVSRSNLAAMRYLKANNVFAFFLPSHTSIWSQPNDNGVNKRFHACVEEVAKRMRRGEREAKIEYHNKIIRAAWALYLKREADDYRRNLSNAAMTSWERTGMEPFNPRCEGWTQGIETFGSKDKLTNENEENKKMHYEIKVRTDATESDLTEDQRKLLRGDGYDLSTNCCMEMAMLRANLLLSKWREHGKAGETPCEMATTDVEKAVIKLFEFVSNRQINSEEEHAERQKRLKDKEREMRRTRASDILTRAEPETAIKITKLTYGDDADEVIVHETPGSVTRTLGVSGQEEWVLFLRGEPYRTVTREQLMDLKTFRLHVPAEHLNEKERKDKQRRSIRMSVRERMHYENEVKDALRKDWEHDMLAEHTKMRMGVYDKFEDFLELARAIKKPYTKDYSYESSQTNRLETVSVTYDNSEFRCVPESVVNAAKKIIVGLDEKGDGSSKRQRDDGATNQPPKKKRTLNGMFVAKRGGNMFECIHQLAKDEQERANNVDEGREKELTKRVERVRSSLNGFVRYKADCDTYNLAQEKNDSPERRNYLGRRNPVF
jgi:hypothetical protein